jgi:hypothetical protein
LKSSYPKNDPVVGKHAIYGAYGHYKVEQLEFAGLPSKFAEVPSFANGAAMSFYGMNYLLQLVWIFVDISVDIRLIYYYSKTSC